MAVLLASAVPATPFICMAFVTLSFVPLYFAGLAWCICLAHITALGLPVFWLLDHKQLVNPWSLLGAGFILGSLPYAIYTWPSWHYIRASYFGGAIFMGAVGAITARTFLAALRRLSPNYALKRTVRDEVTR
ncbi:MAG: hypothetical protein JSR34_02625 [Proteobacteria bacterium]|nr:hypothetical protein [Pseudomonadota bacterium]